MKSIYPTLIKREFWEARSLWIAPLAAAGVLVFMAIAAAAFANAKFGLGGSFRFGPRDF